MLRFRGPTRIASYAPIEGWWGGRLELQLYEGRVIRKLDLPVKAQAMARIIEFVHAELDW